MARLLASLMIRRLLEQLQLNQKTISNFLCYSDGTKEPGETTGTIMMELEDQELLHDILFI